MFSVGKSGLFREDFRSIWLGLRMFEEREVEELK